MSGNALIDFIIMLLVIAGTGAIFFYTIDGISPNATFTKIAKIAIGVTLAAVFLAAVGAVLFGGGGHFASSPVAVIYFAIGVLVVLAVLYLAKMFIGFVLPPPWHEPILFVLGAVCLIALLWWAAMTLFGAPGPSGMIGGRMQPTPSIMSR